VDGSHTELESKGRAELGYPLVGDKTDRPQQGHQDPRALPILLGTGDITGENTLHCLVCLLGHSNFQLLYSV